MSKIILIAIMAYVLYIFITISAPAKQEVITNTVDIPTRIVSAFQQVTEQKGVK